MSEPGPKQSFMAFGYDLLMEGPPEMLVLGPRRRKLIAPMRGLILEVGAGTGVSLRHYGPGARVVATDVDLASLRRLQAKAMRGRSAVLVAAASAQALPFPEGIFDGLVCNLALCTIPDPEAALREVRRVLKPGAPASFLEHVRGDTRGQVRVQEALAPLWAKLAGGCRLAQDTESIIRAAGFDVLRIEKRGGLLLPMKLMWTRTPKSSISV